VVPAVNGISLKVRKGEFVSIMGPSGSGKSTLLNLLGALDKPSSGQILIGGVDISRLDERGTSQAGGGATCNSRVERQNVSKTQNYERR